MNDNGQTDELLTIIKYVKEELLNKAANPEDVNEDDYLLVKQRHNSHRKFIRHKKHNHFEAILSKYQAENMDDLWIKLL